MGCRYHPAHFTVAFVLPARIPIRYRLIGPISPTLLGQNISGDFGVSEKTRMAGC
jgi:hypothetical protein